MSYHKRLRLLIGSFTAKILWSVAFVLSLRMSNYNNLIIYHPSLDFGLSTDLNFDGYQNRTIDQENKTIIFSHTSDNELNDIILGRTILENGWQLNIQVDQTDIKEGLASRFVGIKLVALIALFVALLVAFITAKKSANLTFISLKK